MRTIHRLPRLPFVLTAVKLCWEVVFGAVVALRAPWVAAEGFSADSRPGRAAGNLTLLPAVISNAAFRYSGAGTRLSPPDFTGPATMAGESRGSGGRRIILRDAKERRPAI